MGSDGQSLRAEVIALLDRVTTEPAAVSERALILVTEAGAGPEVVALAQRCYGLSVRGCGHTLEALFWLQKWFFAFERGGWLGVGFGGMLRG